MTTTTTDGIDERWQAELRLSYLQAGEHGPVVVLLHGWGAFKELWWSTLLALAPHYRACALDLPAHGGSPPAGLKTIGELAQRIAAFCDAQEYTSITLVGHSLGGNIALELALLRPDLVARLVLVDAATDAHLMPPFVRFHQDSRYGWASLRIRMLLNQLLQFPGAGVPHRHGGGIVRPWLRRSFYMLRHDPEGLHQTLQALFDNPLESRLHQIQARTLVVTGQFDGMVPMALSRRVARVIPGARFAVIPGAMHNPMDEQPRLFEHVLLNFLREEQAHG